jgi:DNA-binding GntR family transcriptional regulator
VSEPRFIEPLAQASTPSIIADKLRLAIGHGELPAGSQLYEAELARELGVSRGPLREGIQRLTQEGLLISVRNRGVFVIEMTPENVRDMYLGRGAVERAAAEQILRSGEGPAAAAILLGVVDRMAEAGAARDIAKLSDADMEFHQGLVALARSPRLGRMHNTLLTETRMCITALEDSYRFGDDRVGEHRQIAEALRDGDAALVDQLLIEHMEDAVRRLSEGPQTG